MIVRLDEEIWFPSPWEGESDGLIAIGGDLSPDRLLLAYSYGIFPWYSFRESPGILWYCPLKRFVIVPNEIHISHSMRTLLRKGTFTCSINKDFEGVIRNCSELRLTERYAWLGPDMVKAYTKLHHDNLATSIEVWQDQKLVGGLYGVTLGKVFCGESMFSLVPNASKVALIFLAEYMEEHGGTLIDCQFETPHLKSMGGKHIDYETYLGYLGTPIPRKVK